MAIAATVALLGAACGGDSSSTPARSAVAGEVATTTTTAAAPLTVSVDTAAAFGEAASRDGLVRWDAERITVSTSGALTTRDREVLADALTELSATIGRQLVMIEGESADITVLFVPRPTWPSEFAQDRDHVYGVTQAVWNGDGSMDTARVAIDSTIGQASRNLTILHELVHALGLGHVECPTSVVAGGGDGAPQWALSPLDRQLLATWYAPGLDTGDSTATITAALTVVPGEPTCAPQLVEAAETPEGTIWCERTDGAPQPCRLVDGLGSPPAPPFVGVDRWQVGGVIYDHDPLRHEAFLVEGRRLLCEVDSGGGGRRPCQYTDGPGPLTGTDAWTDGDAVYDSP